MTYENYIKAAYIEPIRTVMLVDENFLTISDLCNRIITKNTEAVRLELVPERELWEASRVRKWACDVLTGPDFNVELLRGADLIVLDYHLRGGGNADDSIRIIKELSTTSRSNLIIVYTNEQKLDDAKRRIAATLRGTRVSRDQARQDQIDDLAGEFSAAISVELVERFLRGEESYRHAPGVLAFMNTHGLQVDIIDEFFEHYLGEIPGVPNVESPRRPRISRLEDDPYWVQCGNVFVTLVRKKDYKGKEVFEALERALAAWNPPLLVASLARARHLLTEGGFSLDSDFLDSDPDLHVAWLVHALPQKGEKSSPESLRQLFDRALSQTHDEVLDTLAEHASKLLTQDPGDPLERALTLANVSPPREKNNVYLALNAYLCSEPFRGTHVTTGTIFRCEDAHENYWVCVTPACDMVPRSKDGRSLRMMAVLKLKKVENASKILKDVFHLRHVFIRQGNTSVLVLEAIRSDNARSLETETMYARDLANVKDLSFSIVWVKEAALQKPVGGDSTEGGAGSGAPSALEQKMVIVGQLRQAYASRLLQEAGNFNSRIGVDFAK